MSRLPKGAQLYREAVHNLNTTLEPAERQEALGGTVKVRKEGDAVYARPLN